MSSDKPPSFVSIPQDELEVLLDRAAEKGAKKALENVGLEGEDASVDIRDLRSLLQAFRLARRTAWQTTIRLLTAAILATLLAGLALKLKLFGD